MFLFKNKTLSTLIGSFKLWEDNTKKSNQIETEGNCLFQPLIVF